MQGGTPRRPTPSLPAWWMVKQFLPSSVHPSVRPSISPACSPGPAISLLDDTGPRRLAPPPPAPRPPPSQRRAWLLHTHQPGRLRAARVRPRPRSGGLCGTWREKVPDRRDVLRAGEALQASEGPQGLVLPARLTWRLRGPLRPDWQAPDGGRAAPASGRQSCPGVPR